jgi:flagellar motility protein MotE (MotC chaperone)
MAKKQIIILALAGFLSFVSVFTVNWFFTSKKIAAATAAAASEDSAQVARQQDATFPGTIGIDFSASAVQTRELGMTERQLQNLIEDIRVKAREYNTRQKELDAREERIEITSQSLQQDIDRLNELRDKLSQIQSDIELKQSQLQQSIVEIEGIEQSNFKRLAATYEKMDSAQAGRIMVNMAASNQLQDSVKILYYMNERTAGKLLSEIATTKPELASVICMQLKHVKEGS